MYSDEDFGDLQLDVLKEIGNIGCGHAATSLAKMISSSIDMQVPKVEIIKFEDVIDVIGGAESVVVSTILAINGDIKGHMYFILSQDSAKHVLDLVFNQETCNITFTDIEMSALNEIGNILIGSYISSLANFTKLSIYTSTPATAVDMIIAALDYGLIHSGQHSEHALIVNTVLTQDDFAIEGKIFLLSDPDSLNKLFNVLEVLI